MSVQVRLPNADFTATDLPSILDDPILPSAGGGLMLVDPTHPADPWAAGVPAHEGTVPNIAWSQAAALIGAGSASTLAADIYNTGLSAANGLVERTTLGGLHAIISPTVEFGGATAGFNVAMPQAVYDYVRANYDHTFYLSMWHRVTRAPANPAGDHILITGLNTDSYFGLTWSQKSNLTSGTLDSENTIDDTTGGPRFRNHAAIPGANFGGGVITSNEAATPGHLSLFIVGNRHIVNGTSSSGARRGKGGSRILYRAYLEDLTESGRTYRQVRDIDSVLFTAQCNTAGGRYYGDEFTAASTIE